MQKMSGKDFSRFADSMPSMRRHPKVLALHGCLYSGIRREDLPELEQIIVDCYAPFVVAGAYSHEMHEYPDIVYHGLLYVADSGTVASLEMIGSITRTTDDKIIPSRMDFEAWFALEDTYHRARECIERVWEHVYGLNVIYDETKREKGISLPAYRDGFEAANFFQETALYALGDAALREAGLNLRQKKPMISGNVT